MSLPLLERHQSNVQTRQRRGASGSALSPQPAGDENTEPSSLPCRRGGWQRPGTHLRTPGLRAGPLLLCPEPTRRLRPGLGAAWASHLLPTMLCEHRSQPEAQERNFWPPRHCTFRETDWAPIPGCGLTPGDRRAQTLTQAPSRSVQEGQGLGAGPPLLSWRCPGGRHSGEFGQTNPHGPRPSSLSRL